MSLNSTTILVALAIAASTFAGGYRVGYQRNEAVHVANDAAALLVGLKQAAIDAKAQREVADAIKAQVTRNDTLLRDYEHALGPNTVSNTCHSGLDSLRRLKNLATAAEAPVGQ